MRADSGNRWVLSSGLPASVSAGHTVYDPSESSTAQELKGFTWDIKYVDTSGASGNVYHDTVAVGGITVAAQAVEAAQQISLQFQRDHLGGGLLGLAFSSLNTGQAFCSSPFDHDRSPGVLIPSPVRPQPQKTFFETAIDQGLLQANLFTADLKKGQPGTYDFGFIDPGKYTGDITYTPVKPDRSSWTIVGTGYRVGTDSFVSSSIDAVVDTGTTLLLMDDSVAAAYYAKIPGAQYSQSLSGYTFPCSADPPDFAVGIGDYQAVIPGSYMNYYSVDGTCESAPLVFPSCPGAADSTSADDPFPPTACYGGLQGHNGMGSALFGDIFLKAQFVVFDSDHLQIGVAAKSL